MRDPYTVLVVPRSASDDDIKSAYRKLAKKLHPDLNPGKRGVDQDFKEVTAAYDFLSDPKRRARYDRGEIGPDGAERMHFRQGAPFSSRRAQSAWRRNTDASAGGSEGGIDDIIADFFGRSRKGGAASVEPLAQKVRIPFLEATRGSKRRLVLQDGREVDVAIPAGVDAGQMLRLKDSRGSDTFLEIEIEPHPLFIRKERDIHIEIPINLIEAVLGATITVPTIHGAVAVKVPRGSNSGGTLRLKGKGVTAQGTTGDQYVKLRVTLPDPPDPELVRFLERWSADHAYEVRGKLDEN
jgi:DnaJ-class molecular chaperone